jgi:hypothetical protein
MHDSLSVLVEGLTKLLKKKPETFLPNARSAAERAERSKSCYNMGDSVPKWPDGERLARFTRKVSSD